ncbi:MAG: MBOAT family protein, partial [Lachnospiraceae bacterium]|nr:MBOAT family protein [Lachnospiraceae bacterium]
MLFNSAEYLVFFPIVVIVYFLIPKKLIRVRNLWLLAASYYFYMSWDAVYGLLLFSVTLVTYLAGLLIGAAHGKRKVGAARAVLTISLLINFGLLCYFKYADFMIENVNRVLHTSFSLWNVLLPVGISFYIFQAVGYTIDVYRKETEATKDLFTYALFVSFFPQLVAGPIERSGNLLGQFKEEHAFDADRAREGLLMMLWGLFMKVMIADNLATYVDQVYGGYMAYAGVEIVLATVFFALQIYCDFGGYTYIAIGSAKIMGFTLMENFDAPYQAITVKDFWKRWHISLTGWFKDYLYVSLGGNRKGKVRTTVNRLFVFFVSGLWHGAAWNYVAWGVLNGIYLSIGALTKDKRKELRKKWKVDETSFSYRFGSGLVTFLLVDFSWLFFRAEGMGHAKDLLVHTLTAFQLNKAFGLMPARLGYTTAVWTA